MRVRRFLNLIIFDLILIILVIALVLANDCQARQLKVRQAKKIAEKQAEINNLELDVKIGANERVVIEERRINDKKQFENDKRIIEAKIVDLQQRLNDQGVPR